MIQCIKIQKCPHAEKIFQKNHQKIGGKEKTEKIDLKEISA